MTPIDLTQLKVLPLAQRQSQARLEDILINPDAAPGPCTETNLAQIGRCALDIMRARRDGAAVMLIYGAHLVKNGAADIVSRLLENGWVTHLATNGAGVIHDWEFAFAGVSTESVKDNVAAGTFGAWDETGRNIHLALLAGALDAKGFGASVGQFIQNDGATLPSPESLAAALAAAPSNALAPARAELLLAMRAHQLAAGRHEVKHPWKKSSLLANSFRFEAPLTVHPGIGYDIIANHPMFNGAALGRAGDVDFRLFGSSVEKLDGGVVLSIGSAIMGPQVFEKSLSCVNNLRLQAGRPIVQDHNIYVVDLQDGGHWDWTKGEPPKDNPAYYLRFCKSYSRMGGAMHYVQCDNAVFVHQLLRDLTNLGVIRNMIEFPVDNYDLAATLASGQAFRWRLMDGAWEGVVARRWVRLRQQGNLIRAETAAPVEHWDWLRQYLQLDIDLATICATFPADEPMQSSLRACAGLRLLRQDPWECLASFICSSTKQIVQIQQIVALLCQRFGEPVAVPAGHAPAHTFPTLARLAEVADADLRACKMGFRAPYLLGAARKLREKEIDLEALHTIPLEQARAQLLQLPGVGVKIADCVLLFAYGFQQAFPVDVWIMKALRQLYFPRRRVTLPRLRHFSRTHFGPHSGYAQQYLFHYMRTRGKLDIP